MCLHAIDLTSHFIAYHNLFKMTTRRSFLKQSGIASAGILLGCKTASKATVANNNLIGLQLYTVRSEITKDVNGTLAKVSAIGYNSAEVFGYNAGKFFGLTPEEFLKLLQQNNLKTPSGHYGMNNFLGKGDEDELKRTVADAAKMGHDYFVIPYLTDDMRKSLDDYKTLAQRLNRAAQEVKGTGMKLAYHNHDFEFKDWGNGETGYKILTTQTDPSVYFETDVYWLSKAGKDPLQIFNELKGRVKMWHVKDMANTAEKEFTEVGSGTINYKELFTHRKELGIDYFFVEQDATKIPVYDSIAKSYAYVKNNLVG